MLKTALIMFHIIYFCQLLKGNKPDILRQYNVNQPQTAAMKENGEKDTEKE